MKNPPVFVNDVAEIALLRAPRALLYWSAIIGLAFCLAIASLVPIDKTIPLGYVVGLHSENLCASVPCGKPPASLACGPMKGDIATASRVVWWECRSKGLVGFSILDHSTKPSNAQLNWIFESRAEMPGGLFVRPYHFDEKGSGGRGKRIDLVQIYSTPLFNPTTPTLAAPYPISFMDRAIQADLGTYSDSLGISEESQRERIKAVFNSGVDAFRLRDRTTGTPYFVRRAVSGLIQQATLILFWMFLIIVACRTWVGMAERKKLEDSKRQDADAEDLAKPDTNQPDAEDDLRNARVRLSFLASEEGKVCRSDVLADLSAFALRWTHRNLADIPALVDLQRESISRKWEQEYAPLKFIIWAIPSVGFIGTVVGIGQSMMLTAGLASPDEVDRIRTRGEISSSIAVAFDTTLVALLTTLALMLIFLAMQAKEHGALEEARQIVVGLLSGQERATETPPAVKGS